MSQTEVLAPRRILRATATLFGGNFVLFTLQALQFVFLARLLGATEFGRVAAANALVAIAVPLAGLGYGNLLLMRVSRDRSGLRVDAGNAQLAVGLTGGAMVVIVASLGQRLYGDGTSVTLILALAVNELVLVRSVLVLGQLWQAVDRVERTSLLNMGVGLCRFAAAISLFFMEHPDAETWAITVCALLLLLAIAAHASAVRSFGRPRVDLRRLWRDRAEAVHFLLGTGAKALYTDLDKVFLARWAGAAELGAYTAAYRLVVMAFLPIRSLLEASATQFYRSGAAGLERSYVVTRKLLKLALPYGAAVGVVMVLAAEWVPHLLGPSFSSMTPMLRALALLPLIQAIHYAFSDALTGAGLQRVRTRLQWLTAAVYVGAAALLVPGLGWQGAAAVCVLSESLLAVLVILAVRSRVAAS